MDDAQWMDKVRRCASELERLGVAADVPGEVAQAELKRKRRGRRREIVYAAQVLRSGGTPTRSPSDIMADAMRLERRLERARVRVVEIEAELEAVRMR
jgi:ribosomal 50S subunit-associated protein YjgA (DUF615 family)